VEASRARWKQ